MKNGRKRKGGQHTRNIRVVWEPEATADEIKALREGIERISGEISIVKERMTGKEREGRSNGTLLDPDMVQRLIGAIESKQAEELDRIDRLEGSMKDGLSMISKEVIERGTSKAKAEKAISPPEVHEAPEVRNMAASERAKVPTRKLKVEKKGKEISYVPPRTTSEEAVMTVKRTLKRGLFRGPYEKVSSVEPAYLPLIRCLVNYRAGLTRRSRTGDLYLDPVCSEMVLSTRKGIKRTRGMSVLTRIPPMEKKVFASLGRSGKEDAVVAEECGITRSQSKRALESLVKKAVARTRTGEGNIILYSRIPGLYLDDSPWKEVPDWHPRSVTGLKERIVPEIAEEEFPERCADFLENGIRLMDRDRVLYPIYIVKVTGEGRTRHCIVDAVYGRIDEDLTRISKDIV
jgi:hypothetical protein